MAIRYDRSAPSGWGVNDTGNFVKVPDGYVLQNGVYVAPNQAPAPTSQPAPTYNTTPPQMNSTPVASQQQIDSMRSQGIDLSQYGQTGSGDVSYLRNALEADYDNLQPLIANVNGSLVTVGYTGYKIPKAIVIGPNGERIQVRTDNQTGKYRTEAEMIAQGFRQERAPGVPVNNTQYNTGSAVDYSQRPSLTLSSGQVISPTDPNYDVYRNLQNVTVNGQGAPTGSQVGQPVLLGPSQFNQLVSQGLRETDIERRGADIYLKPTSSFYSQVSGGGGTPGGTTATGSGTTTIPGGGSTTVIGGAQIDPADRAWVNQLYKKFFDRDATSAELTNWSKESPQALEQFLQKEAKTYGYTSSYFKDEGNQRLDAAMNIIKNSNLPQNLKDLWAATVAAYPSGMEYNATEVLNTFNQIKTSTIDPQFAELATIASRDFQRNLNEQKSKFEMDQEAIRAASGENIRQAKEGLEKSGMTFSGRAIEDLGASSAYAQPGTTQGGAMPTQEPFGGLFYEGKVNQQNRLMASSASLANKSTIDALNASLEQQLGSNAAASAGATVQGGITGALETQRQSQYGQTLQQIMDNYRKKQTLNTNITT